MASTEEQVLSAAARNSELLSTLARTDYAPPSLQQQVSYIRELEAEVSRNNATVSKLTASREKEAKDHSKYCDSVMKRFAYKATAQKEKFSSKADKEEREYFEALRAEHHGREEGAQLSQQLAEAKQRKAELEAVAAEHKRAQNDLDNLYNSIFAGQTPSFPDEDQQEAVVRNASDEYRRLEGIIRAEDQARQLLGDAEQGMRKVTKHINEALGASQMDMFGGGGFADYIERSSLGRAEVAVRQVYRTMEQAQRTSPHVHPLPPIQIKQGNLVGDVLFDNIFTDMAFHEKIKASAEEVKRAAAHLRENQVWMDERLQNLRKEMPSASKRLEEARMVLQRVREGIFERLATQSEPPPYYSGQES
jgi:chaperonin cofactor prefoldin